MMESRHILVSRWLRDISITERVGPLDHDAVDGQRCVHAKVVGHVKARVAADSPVRIGPLRTTSALHLAASCDDHQQDQPVVSRILLTPEERKRLV